MRSPKLYLRDTGILHALLEIEGLRSTVGKPSGRRILGGLHHRAVDRPRCRVGRPSFVRTGNGAEIDLLLERGGKRRVFEIKLSKAPKPSRGFYQLIDDVEPRARQ